MIDLFQSEDKQLVEVLNLVLDIGLLTQRTSYQILNPHSMFICLLESVAFDSSTLIDLLISAETIIFLEYFIKYLKFIELDIDQAFETTNTGYHRQVLGNQVQALFQEIFDKLVQFEKTGVLQFSMNPLIQRLRKVLNLLQSRNK